ncbi:MAG: YhcH/YjgK/YiaL family protein [bacterium]|nr:YhcH/YjgK/YiaL family protein [bacterium]
MIKDVLINAEKYYNLSPSIERALKFLQNTDFSKYEKGSYDIDGRNLYMNVEEYTTRVSDNIEAHKKYIDIQYMIKGEENMGVTTLDNLVVTDEYAEEKDVEFYKGDAPLTLVKENEFIIFYPTDAHLPCQVADIPKTVKKVIVKIKI